MGETLAAVTGFSSGFIVAGGVVALMVGLGIITRFIGISHTAAHIRAGENAILFGTVVGTILTVYEVSLPFGSWVLVIAGVFMGTFVGGWIMAQREQAGSLSFWQLGRRLEACSIFICGGGKDEK